MFMVLRRNMKIWVMAGLVLLAGTILAAGEEEKVAIAAIKADNTEKLASYL